MRMTTRHNAIEVSAEAMGELRKAVAEFNAWRFYDCHETLEDVWRESGAKGVATGATNFYQGLIKAAAGFHHVLRDNHKGAVNLLSDSLRLLEGYRPDCLGIDVEALVGSVGDCLQRIEELGPGSLREFERGMIPGIAWVGDEGG
jgi:predicted metal-dependent hydrolase